MLRNHFCNYVNIIPSPMYYIVFALGYNFKSWCKSILLIFFMLLFYMEILTLLRAHSKMKSPKNDIFLDPSCCPLLLFFITPFLPCHHPKSDKTFFRKAHFKVHFGTYRTLHIINLCTDRWRKRQISKIF